MLIAKLLIITLLMVFIIDLSGFIDELETTLSKWLKGKARIPKPFSCSLCMSWWTNLIYLLCIGKLTLPYIAIVALFAFLTPVFALLFVWIRETLNKALNKALEGIK